MTTEVKKKCDVIGCTTKGYISFSMGPGTYVFVCKHHYKEMLKDSD